MRTQLFGAQAEDLRREVDKYPALELVDDEPDVIVCYGGDGTLLMAEQSWPGIPKAPIRNSRRGHRCMPHPPAAVIERLARDELVRMSYMKLECRLYGPDEPDPVLTLTAMNEVNVHMGRINSAVRFTLRLGEEPYNDGQEILGDGFVVSTPFGSTAYFSHITHGVFHTGIGIAFPHTTEHVDHLVVPEDIIIRVRIARGPAILAFDNATDYVPMHEGHEFVARKHPHPATILTWRPMAHPSDDF